MLTLREEIFIQRQFDLRHEFKWCTVHEKERDHHRTIFVEMKDFILEDAKDQTPMTRKLLEVSTKNASRRFKEKLGVL